MEAKEKVHMEEEVGAVRTRLAISVTVWTYEYIHVQQ